MAEIARREEEARLNDPEEQRRIQAEEEQERLRAEEERRLFEENERKILEAWERKKALEEEEEERRRGAEEEELLSNQNQVGHENEVDGDGWEYVEEGPPEIIWQGNEIIVKKKKIRVKKKDTDLQILKEDPNRPTSNPLPPQSEAFADHKNASAPVLSAQQLLETVAQETPNFGTEMDKAHCPFHLKTGACRFGLRCSRIHFYPDKSCTLLIKNMYSGPGLAWEQDEGLEYTDEEVERAYEEFYEDVHTEFLKFGEIVNFKVCRNGSSHLRGNVYVHYKDLDSAVLSYQSANGRYFAGKQVQCEFVGVTRWRGAICGEFMKSKLKSCSRGTACNFIHCFRNPGGDYEWADWDKPPPKYWVKEMAALFGYPDESGHDKMSEQGSPRLPRYHSDRSQSRKIEPSSSSRNYSDDGLRSSEPRWHHRKHPERHNYEQYSDVSDSREKQHGESAPVNHQSDRYWSDRDGVRQSYSSNLPPSCRKRKLESGGGRSDATSIHETDPDENMRENERSRSSSRHREEQGRGARSKSGTAGKGGWQRKRMSTASYDDDGCSDDGEAEYESESPRDRRSSKYRKNRLQKSELVDERGRWEPS
ncbi:Zinc finger C-x8-C-x5-C-x3-H type family protein [Perilla frutescens var. frutescens]|nr:Zinc finger C-x8-C-x5-C-x3-H type family protein [Perilla frutescens var. frutescens]